MKICKKKTRFLQSIMSVLLAIILVTSLAVAPVAANSSQLDGESDLAEILSGDSAESSGESEETAVVLGESDDPEKDYTRVEISNADELRALAARVNGGDSMKEHLVLLTSNIYLDKGVMWEPIGNDPLTPFSGVFDGQGFIVSGLIVDKEVNGGLFGYLVDAKIRNTTLIDFAAKNSTSGIFYSSVRSTIDMSRTAGGGLMMAAFSFDIGDAVGITTGMPDAAFAGTLVGMPGTYKIDSPEKLMVISDEVNNNYETFDGYTFIIEKSLDFDSHAWDSIGDDIQWWGSLEVPFKGTIIGTGSAIYNLDAPLFSNTDGATITGLTLIDSNINIPDVDNVMAATGVGALVGAANNTKISDIHIVNATITAGSYNGGMFGTTTEFGLGGAIGAIGGVDSVVSRVFVEGTSVEGDMNVGGVVGVAQMESLDQLVMFEGSVKHSGGIVIGSNTTAGLVGAYTPDHSGSLANSMVIGTTLHNSEAAGLVWT